MFIVGAMSSLRDYIERLNTRVLLLPAYGLRQWLPGILLTPDQMHRYVQVLHQIWRKVIIKKIDETSEGFGSSCSSCGLIEQVNQRIIHVLT